MININNVFEKKKWKSPKGCKCSSHGKFPGQKWWTSIVLFSFFIYLFGSNQKLLNPNFSHFQKFGEVIGSYLPEISINHTAVCKVYPHIETEFKGLTIVTSVFIITHPKSQSTPLFILFFF